MIPLSAGVSVEDALFELGIDHTVRGVEANALCPMHKGRTGKEDHNPSWWINLENGAFICFSCHYRGNLLTLVSDVKGFTREAWGITRPDYEAAKSWLMSIGQVSPGRLAELLSAIPNYVSATYELPQMSEAHLAVYVDPPQHALASRGITAESANKYQILWDEKTASWILPIREPHTNKLLGWQEKGTREKRFRNHPPGVKKSHALFGSHLDVSERAVIVESPLDCARFDSAGISGAVAIMGSQLTEDQFKIVRFSDTIIFASDNPKIDGAGKKAAKQAHELALKYGVNLSFFNYGDTGKKDPGDMTDAELHWGMSNAKSYLFGELAYT